jgi:hypothetical protein
MSSTNREQSKKRKAEIPKSVEESLKAFAVTNAIWRDGDRAEVIDKGETPDYYYATSRGADGSEVTLVMDKKNRRIWVKTNEQ